MSKYQIAGLCAFVATLFAGTAYVSHRKHSTLIQKLQSAHEATLHKTFSEGYHKGWQDAVEDPTIRHSHYLQYIDQFKPNKK